ncbi:MAG: DUF362 domain-containing protein [Eubacteriales bacterium]
MNKKIAILEADDYGRDLIERVVEELFQCMAVTEKISEHTKILLKPNLLAKHPPEHAVTTHPEVVRSVIVACKKRGAKAKNIIVADSAGGLYNPAQMKSLYQTCGLTAVCREENVVLYSACESTAYHIQNGAVVTEFEILKPVLEADFIINLPKMKSHVMTGMTAACKNMFGVIPGLKKSEWHMRFPDKERFGEMLIDLLDNIMPNLAILDGVLAMEGDGPAGGNPRKIGVMMASEDMVNMDLAIAYMMGLDPMRVPYLKAANRRGLGEKEINLADVIGEVSAFKVISDWKIPKSYQGSGDGFTDFADHMPKFLRPVVRKIEDKIAPRPVIDSRLCIGCGKCAEICSKDAIVIKNKKAIIGKKKCIRCFCCHEMCPVKAIAVKKFKLFRL